MCLQGNSCLRNTGGTTGPSSSQQGRCCEEMEWAAPRAGRTVACWVAKRVGSTDWMAEQKAAMWDGKAERKVAMMDEMVGMMAGI